MAQKYRIINKLLVFFLGVSSILFAIKLLVLNNEDTWHVLLIDSIISGLISSLIFWLLIRKNK